MLESPKARWFAAAALLGAGLGVYANSLTGPFIFDDIYSIVESPNVRSLSPIGEALRGPLGSGASGRPLVALSLALNYAVGGLDVIGYHIFNVLAHVLTALALFGFARRALLRTSFAAAATALSFSCALVWVVHPLTSSALNHVITRNEVLPALFMLSCLWLLDSGVGPGKSKLWHALAVLACGAAMLSKEIAVSLPLIALAYDRSFIAGSFKEAWAARRKLYVGLLATWLLLALAIASGGRGATVGFGRDLSSLDYLRTQAQGLVHYLRLCVWPSHLALDYSGWAPVTTWGPALLPGALILLLFAASVWGFVRGNKSAWVALSIFAILAPSSSLIPITGEWLAEHRMYLPLTGVLMLLGSALLRILKGIGIRRPAALGIALALASAGPLAMATVKRNRTYASDVAIWEDCLDNYPNNARAHDHLAAIWLGRGEFERALGHAQEAFALDPTLYTVEFNLGTILQQLGQHERSLEHFERAAPQFSDSPRFHLNYGVALGHLRRYEQAIAELRRAIQLDLNYATAHRNLGSLLFETGDSEGALVAWRRALELQPDPATLLRVIRLLASDPNPRARNGAQALAMCQLLIRSGPPDPRWFDLLGMSHAALGHFDAALAASRKALGGAQQLRQPELAAGIRERIKLYENEQPFRSARP